MVAGEWDGNRKSLGAAGMKVDSSEDFWRRQKMRGMALAMILIRARKLELAAGFFMA